MVEHDPLLTLALLVFGGATAAFFSQEWIAMCKKFFSIPGMKILFPMLVVSWVFERYEVWWLWLLQWCQKIVFHVVSNLEAYVPFKMASFLIARVLCLFLVASFPIWIFHLIVKRREDGQKGLLAYRLALVLWVVAVVLLAATV